MFYASIYAMTRTTFVLMIEQEDAIHSNMVTKNGLHVLESTASSLFVTEKMAKIIYNYGCPVFSKKLAAFCAIALCIKLRNKMCFWKLAAFW